jgi:hypothetical protein
MPKKAFIHQSGMPFFLLFIRSNQSLFPSRINDGKMDGKNNKKVCRPFSASFANVTTVPYLLTILKRRGNGATKEG